MQRNRIEVDIEKLLPTKRLLDTEKFHRIQIRSSVYEVLCELRRQYRLWDTEAVIIKLLENTAEMNEELKRLVNKAELIDDGADREQHT